MKLEKECYDLFFVDSKCNADETANAGFPETSAITLQEQSTENVKVMSNTMRFKAHVASCLRKYFDRRGKASHSEYWDFFRFYYVVILGMAFIRKVILGHVCPFWGDGVSQFFTVLLGVADWAVLLALIPPCYAVTVRRLNALGYEAWLAIPIFVPLTFLYLHFKYVYYCIGAKCLAEYNADPWYNILLLKPIVDPYKVLLLTLLIQYLVFDKKDDISNTSDVETK